MNVAEFRQNFFLRSLPNLVTNKFLKDFRIQYNFDNRSLHKNLTPNEGTTAIIYDFSIRMIIQYRKNFETHSHVEDYSPNNHGEGFTPCALTWSMREWEDNHSIILVQFRPIPSTKIAWCAYRAFLVFFVQLEI
jgi:hypothetical protein